MAERKKKDKSNQTNQIVKPLGLHYFVSWAKVGPLYLVPPPRATCNVTASYTAEVLLSYQFLGLENQQLGSLDLFNK